MTPEARTAQTLATVEPPVAAAVRQVLAAMQAIGHEMVAYDGRRTAREQQALYAKGRTAPGKIVTHLDGLAKRSRHQDGLAVDCAFVSRSYGDRWDLRWDGPWEAYGACGEAVGLTWGGRWRMRDQPHLESR